MNLERMRTRRRLTTALEAVRLTILRSVLVLLSCLAAAGAGADSTSISAAEIDRVTEAAMEAWNVPGMAVGVVHQGETLYASGHGVLELGRPEPVDTDTLFRIASASKAFTTAALAVLVEEGKLSWDDPVADHIAEFRMNDAWVTAEISIADLLAHRTGLTPHAGDLLLWPVPNEFTLPDIINALRYFPLERGFRAGYSYDNLAYLVAGEVVARASGVSWGEYVDQRIMRPLGMKRCFAGRVPDEQMRNLAVPHGEVEGEWVTIDRNRIPQDPTVFAPAGGVVCSLSDLLVWVRTQLAGGQTPDGGRLYGPGEARRMWSPHNWLGVGRTETEMHRTNFKAYGLGWRIRDVFGYREVSHTGSLDGMRSHVLMIPELELGIVVLANGSSSTARSAVMYSIEHAFLPAPGRDWVDTFLRLREEEEAEVAPVEEPSAAEEPAVTARPPSLALESYAGVYRDPWFGDVTVIRSPDGWLEFSAAKSPRLSGPLAHHSGDVFIVRWGDRSLEMDAYVRFQVDEQDRVQGLRMKRLNEDGANDPDHFQYLDFTRVGQQ